MGSKFKSCSRAFVPANGRDLNNFGFAPPQNRSIQAAPAARGNRETSLGLPPCIGFIGENGEGRQQRRGGGKKRLLLRVEEAC